ncbi:MAG: biotin-dependent carboxyltransferase family protein [Zavarzinella sp.]
MTMRIIQPGLSTILVAEPHPGLRARGIAPQGPADQTAFCMLNNLLGNPPGTPALEMTLQGPVLQFTDSATLGIVGAPFEIVLDQQRYPTNRLFRVAAGQIVRFVPPKVGCRAYMGIAGGFRASRPLYSPLKTGDVFRTPTESSAKLKGFLPEDWLNFTYSHTYHLRVVYGLQTHQFKNNLSDMFSGDYIAQASSNRMGIRLNGRPLIYQGGELTSEPVAQGAIQITHNQQPIILGVDAQTIGGYPKIAHVIQADCDQLAHVQPGDRIRFTEVSLEEAQNALQDIRLRAAQFIDVLVESRK